MDTKPMTTTIFFDGLCEPRNPGGYACYGYVIEAAGKTETGKGLVTKGPKATNNLAEYTALIEALKAAKEWPGPYLIKGDSQLVVNQVTGRWQCKASHLQPLVKKARSLLGQLGQAKLQWVPREQNEHADQMSREAYREART